MDFGKIRNPRIQLILYVTTPKIGRAGEGVLRLASSRIYVPTKIEQFWNFHAKYT